MKSEKWAETERGGSSRHNSVPWAGHRSKHKNKAHAPRALVCLMCRAVSSVVSQSAAAVCQRLWRGPPASSPASTSEWGGPVAHREGSFASRAAYSWMEQAAMAMGDVSKKASTRNLAVERKNLLTVCRWVHYPTRLMLYMVMDIFNALSAASDSGLSVWLLSLSVQFLSQCWWCGRYDDTLPGARTSWHPRDLRQDGSIRSLHKVLLGFCDFG